MANSNIAAAAQLQGSAGQTALGIRRSNDERRAGNQRLAGQGLQTAGTLLGQQVSERGAGERQQAQLKAESDAQKIIVTEQLANGFEKATGDPSLKESIGQPIDSRAFAGLLESGIKLNLAQNFSIETANQGENVITFGFNKKTGERLPFAKGINPQVLKAKGTKQNTQNEVRLRSIEGRVQDFVKRFSKEGAIPSESFFRKLKAGVEPKLASRMKSVLADAERTEKFLEEIDSLRTSLGRDPSPEAQAAREMIGTIREAIPESIRQGGDEQKKVTFVDSDGDEHTILESDLPAARKQDPELKVLKRG